MLGSWLAFGNTESSTLHGRLEILHCVASGQSWYFVKVFWNVVLAVGLIQQLLCSPNGNQIFREKTLENITTKRRPHSVRIVKKCWADPNLVEAFPGNMWLPVLLLLAQLTGVIVSHTNISFTLRRTNSICFQYGSGPCKTTGRGVSILILVCLSSEIYYICNDHTDRLSVMFSIQMLHELHNRCFY